MELVDGFIFAWAIFLLIIGLIFVASGFGILIIGRLDGILFVISGVAMFWGGWIVSGSHSLPCAIASVLNIIDAASTVAFWNFEKNPIVVAAGPTLFLIAKVASSLTIMLFARFYSNPKKGGIALSVFYAVIAGWNMSQHLRAYLGLETFAYGIILGTAFSLLASAAVMYAILAGGYMKGESFGPVKNKFIAAGLISLLALSVYLAWENNTLNNYYDELSQLYSDLTKKYNQQRDEAIHNLTVMMPRGLDEHYERIRLNQSGRFLAKGDQGRLLFYATQILHDLGDYSYGGYCSELSRIIGDECKNLTWSFAAHFSGYMENLHPNVSRIEQAYRWVNDFISRVNDSYGYSRFPIETLVHRCGDCEDQAMALSFLLKRNGYETALCIIHDDNLTEYGLDGLYREFCAVRKNGFEYDGTLIQLDEYPESGESWIVLDPAFDHEFGEDPEWMTHYRQGDGTILIQDAALTSILVDFDELTFRARAIGIDL